MGEDRRAAQLRRWRLLATEGLAAAIEAAPDAIVPAYPHWRVRDLAVHVVRIYGTAALALTTGTLERPRPELRSRGDDAARTLARAVRRGLEEAEAALERCQQDVVWTPVGPRDPSFWCRRLLREAVLHRWDAEQANRAARAPLPDQALELIAEFLDTDVVRAIADIEPTRCCIVLRSGERRWTVDMRHGAVAAGGDDRAANATIGGEPAAVWLWLMRRDGLPGPVAIDDVDGCASAFTDLVARFKRPGS